jgi:hypothetical protein
VTITNSTAAPSTAAISLPSTSMPTTQLAAATAIPKPTVKRTQSKSEILAALVRESTMTTSTPPKPVAPVMATSPTVITEDPCMCTLLRVVSFDICILF